jgi:hypothetical protein
VEVNFVNCRCLRPFFELVFIAVLASTIFLAGCSSLMGEKRDDIDWVKNPNSAVGQCFRIDANQAVLAANDSDDMFGFARKINEQSIAAKSKSTAKDVGKPPNAKNFGITDLNVDAAKQRNTEDLTVVVLGSDKCETATPVLKVRVANKAYAGLEVWIAASCLRDHGHKVSFKSR